VELNDRMMSQKNTHWTWGGRGQNDRGCGQIVTHQ